MEFKKSHLIWKIEDYLRVNNITKYDKDNDEFRKVNFGRTMPFGKYKNDKTTWLIVRHPFYCQWLENNTSFRFTEEEKEVYQYMQKLNESQYFKNAVAPKLNTMALGYLDENKPTVITEMMDTEIVYPSNEESDLINFCEENLTT